MILSVATNRRSFLKTSCTVGLPALANARAADKEGVIRKVKAIPAHVPYGPRFLIGLPADGFSRARASIRRGSVGRGFVGC